DGWRVAQHAESVTVKYKVYGDRVDGTYLAVDTTHAHINMPAAIMWARGLDDRPVVLTLDQPAGMHWQVATQLHGDGSPVDTRRPVPDTPVDTRRPVPDTPVDTRRPVPDTPVDTRRPVPDTPVDTRRPVPDSPNEARNS